MKSALQAELEEALYGPYVDTTKMDAINAVHCSIGSRYDREGYGDDVGNLSDDEGEDLYRYCRNQGWAE